MGYAYTLDEVVGDAVVAEREQTGVMRSPCAANAPRKSASCNSFVVSMPKCRGARLEGVPRRRAVGKGTQHPSRWVRVRAHGSRSVREGGIHGRQRRGLLGR